MRATSAADSGREIRAVIAVQGPALVRQLDPLLADLLHRVGEVLVEALEATDEVDQLLAVGVEQEVRLQLGRLRREHAVVLQELVQEAHVRRREDLVTHGVEIAPRPAQDPAEAARVVAQPPDRMAQPIGPLGPGEVVEPLRDDPVVRVAHEGELEARPPELAGHQRPHHDRRDVPGAEEAGGAEAVPVARRRDGAAPSRRWWCRSCCCRSR
jgi:hypothetical protein